MIATPMPGTRLRPPLSPLEKQPIIDAIRRITEAAQSTLTIFAPYITVDGLNQLIVSCGARSIDVVTTWRSADVAVGASDPRIYEVLQRRGNGTVRLLHDLHLKVVLADFEKMFVTSANITRSGLGLARQPNIECGVVCRASKGDADWFRQLLQNSQIVTEAAYRAFLNHMHTYAGSSDRLIEDFDWSKWKLFENHKNPLPESDDPDQFVQLWLSGFNLRRFNSQTRHDLGLLGLTAAVPTDEYSARAMVQKAYVSLALVQDLFRFVRTERYFGALRAWLRRRLGKNTNVNYASDATRRLLTWTAKLCPQFELDRPNYSYRLMNTSQTMPIRQEPPSPAYLSIRGRKVCQLTVRSRVAHRSAQID